MDLKKKKNAHWGFYSSRFHYCYDIMAKSRSENTDEVREKCRTETQLHTRATLTLHRCYNTSKI